MPRFPGGKFLWITAALFCSIGDSRRSNSSQFINTVFYGLITLTILPPQHAGIGFRRPARGAAKEWGLMEHGINVCVEKGCLRVFAEIPVSTGREGLEDFLSELSLIMLGDKKLPKLSSSGIAKKVVFTESEAAAYLGCSKSFLRKSRIYGEAGGGQRGPKFIRHGKRGRRYLKEDLDAWLSSHKKYGANCEVQFDD